MEKILIAPSSFGESNDEPLAILKSRGYSIIDNPYKRRLTENELLELLPGITGIIAGLEPLNKKVLESSELKVISRCGVGLSNVDLKTASDLGIIVKNTPEAHVTSVAETTVGCLITLLHKISLMDRDMHEGKWKKRFGVQLSGKTVLIIGYGKVGRRLAELLKPFGVRFLIYDPQLTDNANGNSIISLEEGLTKADIISLHASGSTEIIGDKEFALMKDGVFILNSARGGLINELSLIKSLNEKKVGGIWLDTFWEEPYKGPLLKFDSVLLSPHASTYTRECRFEMEMESAYNLINALTE